MTYYIVFQFGQNGKHAATVNLDHHMTPRDLINLTNYYAQQLDMDGGVITFFALLDD